jgi:hypothetical protein
MATRLAWVTPSIRLSEGRTDVRRVASRDIQSHDTYLPAMVRRSQPFLVVDVDLRLPVRRSSYPNHRLRFDHNE